MHTAPIRRGNFLIHPDGTMEPPISGGFDDDAPVPPAPEAEAESAEAPAAEVDPGTEVVDEAAGPAEFVLPEIDATWDDDRATALHAQIEEQAATLAAELVEKQTAGTATLADVASLKSLRTAQQSLVDLLQARVDERALVAEQLTELATGAELPEAIPARAAAAAQVVRVISEAPPSVEQTDTARAASDRTASAAEQPMPWRSTQEGGSTANWQSMVNEGKLPHGTPIDPRRPVVLASARVVDDESRLLTDSVSRNERIVAEAQADHRAARLEAGGGARMAAICDPATIMRDAFVCGTTATPFQSSLVGLTASSGNALKYEYRLPTSIAVATDGIATWDVADQADVDPTDPETWKPTVAIACASYATAVASEQTASYTVDAFTELSSPESVADFVQAKDRAFARHTEGWYLRKADSFLHHYTWDASAADGAVPQIIEMVLTVLANGRFGERLDMAEGYVVYGSPGLLYALTADENHKAYRDGQAAIAAIQQAVENATGTSYVQLLDVPHTDGDGTWGSSPFAALPAVGGGGVALPRLSTLDYSLRVLDPSSMVAFTTGEATFGEQVTLDQARQNQRGFFQRMFGGLMKPGCEPGFKISISDLIIDGSRGGFLTPESEAVS